MPPEREKGSFESHGAPADSEIEEVLRQVSGEVPQDVIEIAGQDTVRSREAEAELDAEKRRKPESFYSDLIFTLAGIRYGEVEAKLVWVNLLAHKWDMSQRMGRNVGIRVAALDFFSNVMGELARARIMDSRNYIQTARLAVTDGLTGLYNHRYLMERLGQDVRRARESGGKLSLLRIDIDHFKTYNDINGHMAGDVAIREVASAIRSSAKREDVCARYGGEEFAVVAYGTDKAEATGIAERLRLEVERRDFPNEEVLPGGDLTVSCGVASLPEDAADRGGLIEYADRTLYVAKSQGRNRVCSAVSERRRHERLKRPFRVSWRPRGTDGGFMSAELLNVSLRGVGLRVAEGVEENSVVELKIASRQKGAEIGLLGRTIWVRSPREGLIECGVRFVGLEPEVVRRLEGMIRESPEPVE